MSNDRKLLLKAANKRIEALEAEVEKWHRVAMEAGAITCVGGGHIYPLRARIEALEAALQIIAADYPYIKIVVPARAALDQSSPPEEASRRHNFEDAGFDTCRHCGERKVHPDHGEGSGI